MTKPADQKWYKNVALLSVAVRVLSVVESLLPVFFSTWNDFLRQKNANLEAELDLVKTKKRISKKIKKASLDKDSLSYINEYLETKEKGFKNE